MLSIMVCSNYNRFLQELPDVAPINEQSVEFDESSISDVRLVQGGCSSETTSP